MMTGRIFMLMTQKVQRWCDEEMKRLELIWVTGFNFRKFGIFSNLSVPMFNSCVKDFHPLVFWCLMSVSPGCVDSKNFSYIQKSISVLLFQFFLMFWCFFFFSIIPKDDFWETWDEMTWREMISADVVLFFCLEILFSNIQNIIFSSGKKRWCSNNWLDATQDDFPKEIDVWWGLMMCDPILLFFPTEDDFKILKYSWQVPIITISTGCTTTKISGRWWWWSAWVAFNKNHEGWASDASADKKEKRICQFFTPEQKVSKVVSKKYSKHT